LELKGSSQPPTSGDFSKSRSTLEFYKHDNDELGVPLNNQHFKTLYDRDVKACFQCLELCCIVGVNPYVDGIYPHKLTCFIVKGTTKN
jgi:hypothetical protein